MPSDSRRNGERRENERGKRSSSEKRNRTSWRDGLSSEPTEPDTPIRQERPRRSNETANEVGHKWRNIQRESQPGGELPPLPGQESGNNNRRSGVGSRAIIFGAVLLAIVVAMLFLPFSPLMDNGSDPDPTATSEVAQTTAVATDPSGEEVTAVPTNEPAETVESDFLVCIDPGHGGWDYGRERMDMNEFGPPWFHESEVTLSLSYFLRDELESRNIAVVMTRETGGAVNFTNEDVNGDGQVMDDTPEGLIAGHRDEAQARINICNEAGANIMVSIHLNGFDDQSVGGYQIYYNSTRDFSQNNQDLATFLYREMTVAFDDLGYAADPRGPTDDVNLSAETHEFGSEQYPLIIGPRVVKPEYTIEPTNMPGVIIETLFVTNTNDANFILNPTNQKRLAVAWADGIDIYRERYGE